MEIPSDIRHPFAIAAEEFFASGLGQRLCEGPAGGVHLKNRLWEAFVAGLEVGSDIRNALVRHRERLNKRNRK